MNAKEILEMATLRDALQAALSKLPAGADAARTELAAQVELLEGDIEMAANEVAQGEA